MTDDRVYDLPPTISKPATYANYSDKDKYEQGVIDACECMRKIVASPDKGGLRCDELTSIFGTDSVYAIMERYSPSEMLTKVKSYEESRFCVGDEVERIRGEFVGKRYVILSTTHLPVFARAITGDGEVVNLDANTCKKTGRHFPQIEEVLEQIPKYTTK